MQFLNEVGALAKIREIFGLAQQAKIAVAFWGQGAVQALGIDRPDLEVEIICNLDSGACNPAELGKLRSFRPHNTIRSDPRLHGKLYWTPGGVVIGSSNASTNGLAVEEGLAGWAEANVFSDEPRLIESALNWFKSRQENSYEITDAHLFLAERIWNDRAASAPLGINLTGDLGAAVRAAPDLAAWSKVKLAIYAEDFSVKGKKRIREDRKADPALKAFGAYESWHTAIDAGDWILDFWLQNERAQFGGYFSVPDEKLENELLTYVLGKACVILPGLGALQLSAIDQRDLEMAALVIARTQDNGGPPCAMVPISKAISIIDQKGNLSPLDLTAFDRAMRDIFTEATKIGYRPTEFLKMLNRDGAISTARRLILSSAPSSGFARLWELKRLDLTVEALALRAPWRQLFTESELAKATKRLKELGYRFER